jgi:hypothetical protein
MNIHLTVFVFKCVEGKDFVNTANHTYINRYTQQPNPDSQNHN